MGQGSDVVTVSDLCKPPTKPAFLSTTLFNWSPAPSMSGCPAFLEDSRLWPPCLSLLQPPLQSQTVALSALLCLLQCVCILPGFWSLAGSFCLLVSSYWSCEFSPLNILYCPFIGFWKRAEVNICVQSARFNEKRDYLLQEINISFP